jgi:hypothetical protein
MGQGLSPSPTSKVQLKGLLKKPLASAGIGIPARNWFGKSNSRTNLKTAKASFRTPKTLLQQSLKLNTPVGILKEVFQRSLNDHLRHKVIS